MEILVVLALMFTNIWAFQLPTNDSETKGRIYKGFNAGVGQFPYVVALESRSGTCAGALIGREWVVTAAHCLYGQRIVSVYLGATHIGNPKVGYYIPSSSFVIHPSFNTDPVEADIALINIPTTNICEDIFPVPLPSLKAAHDTYLNKYAIITGWGRKGNIGAYTSFRSDTLQWTRVTVVSNSVCVIPFRGLIHARNEICVGTVDGSSACPGDSGGPLVLEDTAELVGILAAGKADCERGYPTIYTRVTSYLLWIEDVTGISY